MGRTASGVSRSSALTLGMLVLVIGAGFGGMLLAKQFHQPFIPVASESGLLPPTRPAFPARRDPAAIQPLDVPPVSPGTPDAGPEDRPVVPPNPASADQGVADSTPIASVPDDTASAPQSVQSADADSPDNEIGLALYRWQTALLSNDATQIASAYSSQVKRYFLQQDVSRAYIAKYLSQEEAGGFRLQTYDLQKLSIEHVGRHAVDVHFVANFKAATPAGERTGRARTLLKLHQEDGQWKIYFERDYSG